MPSSKILERISPILKPNIVIELSGSQKLCHFNLFQSYTSRLDSPVGSHLRARVRIYLSLSSFFERKDERRNLLDCPFNCFLRASFERIFTDFQRPPKPFEAQPICSIPSNARQMEIIDLSTNCEPFRWFEID